MGSWFFLAASLHAFGKGSPKSFFHRDCLGLTGILLNTLIFIIYRSSKLVMKYICPTRFTAVIVWPACWPYTGENDLGQSKSFPSRKE